MAVDDEEGDGREQPSETVEEMRARVEREVDEEVRAEDEAEWDEVFGAIPEADEGEVFVEDEIQDIGKSIEE